MKIYIKNLNWRKKIAHLLAIAALCPIIVPAHATPVTDVALFNRCYTQLTGKRPSFSNALRLQVETGSVSGLQACTTLLNKPVFGNSNAGGGEGLLTSQNDLESVAIVNQLNDFHRTWYLSDNLDAAITDQDSAYQRDREIFDETQPALHITRALFQSDVPYSDVVTNSSAMDAMRSNGTAYEPTWDGTRGYLTDQNTAAPQKLRFNNVSMGTTLPSGSDLGNYNYVRTQPESSFPLLNPELVQTGSLQGVKRTALNGAKMGLSVYSTAGAGIAQQKYPAFYFNAPISVHESLGAGYLGTKPYLMLNLGRPGATFSDGGLDMPRRWAKAVLTEALCRDMPPVRSSDATIFVQGKSVLPFRNARQCMECHSAMDPLAAVARNVTIRSTGGGDNQRMSGTSQLAIHPVTAPQKPGFQEADIDFYKRPPDGTLFFRSYNGDKISLPISGGSSAKDGMANLGRAIAGTNDLYVCAAARYYQYFTGIKVSLQDIGDPAKPALSSTDLNFRNEVIKLGLALKNHQSLRTLISDIFKSETYRKVSPRSGN